MSTRLQVLLDEEELTAIRAAAQARHMTVAEWVRQALRQARMEQPGTSADRKLQVLRESARYAYATGDIEELLRETARGRNMGIGGGDA